MHKRKWMFVLTGLVLVLALISSACAPATVETTQVETAQKEKLVLAVQPTATPEKLTAEAKDIEAFLEARMSNVDIEIVFPTFYGGVIEALKYGHAQAAFLSAWPAALAGKYAGAEVVLAEVREVVIGEEKVERPYYYSYWVVLKDSPYTSLEQLKGKKAAFSSLLSTSGYVAPLARLVELGFVKTTGKAADPKQFFAESLFAGGYAQAWEALKQKQVDVTVIAGDVSETLYREVLAGTRVLEQQGPIPSHGVVFSKDLKEPLRSQLKNALLELGKPENRDLMRKFISGIFVGFSATTSEEHLGSLSKFLELTGVSYTETLK